ncbi:hypothetical protein [Streptomyces sp. NPDC058548]
MSLRLRISGGTPPDTRVQQLPSVNTHPFVIDDLDEYAKAGPRPQPVGRP